MRSAIVSSMVLHGFCHRGQVVFPVADVFVKYSFKRYNHCDHDVLDLLLNCLFSVIFQSLSLAECTYCKVFISVLCEFHMELKGARLS